MTEPIITKKTLSIDDAQHTVTDLEAIAQSDKDPGYSPSEVIRARSTLLDTGLFRFQSSITAASLAAFVTELKSAIGVAESAQTECVTACGGYSKQKCLVQSKCGRSIALEIHETAEKAEVYSMPVKTSAIPAAQDWRERMKARLSKQQ